MAEAVSAITPNENDKKMNALTFENTLINMKSELDAVEVQTVDKTKEYFSIDGLFNFKVYSYEFICQYIVYKPAVVVLVNVVVKISVFVAKYT